MAFGHSFNMLQSTKPHYFFHVTRINMVLIAGFSRLIWLFPIFKALPLLNFQYNAFRRWIDAFVLNRKEHPPEVLDVFAPILEEYEKKPKREQNFDDLIADASTTVVAGSDTTAGTLTCLLYLLARHPAVYRKLQTELDQLAASIGRSPDNQDLARLPYLQACIDECMRLFHPIPSGMQRVTPPEGLTVDSTFIPGDTLVQMPWHILHRDPRCFARPDEFIPERWTSRREELVLAASVFQPFGVGRHSCVGKQLGLMEVRRVVALIASQYDLQLSAGAENFEDGLEDLFTFEMPKLELILSHR
jgi:cytochrome P450 family 628